MAGSSLSSRTIDRRVLRRPLVFYPFFFETRLNLLYSCASDMPNKRFVTRKSQLEVLPTGSIDSVAPACARARTRRKDERLRSFLTGQKRRQTRVLRFDRSAISFFFFSSFPSLLDRLHSQPAVDSKVVSSRQQLHAMDEAAADGDKLELPTPPIANLVEDSIASRTKEITKRAKRERSPRKPGRCVR